MDYVSIPLDVQVPSMATPYGYAIAATHRTTGKRLLIKVSHLATREQLLQEIKRMNAPTGRRPQFIYTLTNEGATV